MTTTTTTWAELPRDQRHREIWEFTPRQRDVLGRLLRGTVPQEIAFRLGLGIRTVYWHIENVYRLTGTHSLGEFFGWAQDHKDCCSIGLVWGYDAASQGGSQ